MKKTFTVNLGGTVFHIDEDAYQLLDKYLSNLRIHFQKEDSSGEIMDDFEMRIAELLNERIRLGYEVITIEHVEEVIRRMGKPEEIFDVEDDTKEPKQASFSKEAEQSVRKRLMRDPDNRILGGVASGLAAYMGWDPTAIRIVFLILMFFYGIVTPIYLVLWILMPKAETATEKLEMRGESVTIESIGKTVTDGFERISDEMSDAAHSDKPRNFLKKVADVFVAVFGFILKFVMVLVGIILLPILGFVVFLLAVVTIAMLAGGAEFLYGFFPFGMNWLHAVPMPVSIVGCIGGLLLVGIPLCALIYALCAHFFKMRPISSQAKWVLIVLWLIALVLSGIYIYQSYMFTDWGHFPSMRRSLFLP